MGLKISNKIRLNNIRWSEDGSQKLEEIFQTNYKPTSVFSQIAGS